MIIASEIETTHSDSSVLKKLRCQCDMDMEIKENKTWGEFKDYYLEIG